MEHTVLLLLEIQKELYAILKALRGLAIITYCFSNLIVRDKGDIFIQYLLTILWEIFLERLYYLI